MPESNLFRRSCATIFVADYPAFCERRIRIPYSMAATRAHRARTGPARQAMGPAPGLGAPARAPWPSPSFASGPESAPRSSRRGSASWSRPASSSGTPAGATASAAAGASWPGSSTSSTDGPSRQGYPRGVSSPELSVVCRSCGEEVSPYVTECPYCGTRLRKRAPKLELRGDELTPRQSRRSRRRQARAQRTERLGERPYAVIAAILIPALSCSVRVASPSLDTYDLGRRSSGPSAATGGATWPRPSSIPTSAISSSPPSASRSSASRWSSGSARSRRSS